MVGCKKFKWAERLNIERHLNFAGVKSNKTNLFRYIMFRIGVRCHFLFRVAWRVYVSVEALLMLRLGVGENSYRTFIRKLTTFLSCRKKMNVQG